MLVILVICILFYADHELTTGDHAGPSCLVLVVVVDCDGCCLVSVVVFNVTRNCDKHWF